MNVVNICKRLFSYLIISKIIQKKHRYGIKGQCSQMYSRNFIPESRYVILILPVAIGNKIIKKDRYLIDHSSY